jgi:hypothetical protein
MYVMIITFLFYSDPAGRGQFSPAVESVLFKSKESCETARSTYLSSVSPIADELAAAINNEKSVGDLRGPAGVVISAICVAQ